MSASMYNSPYTYRQPQPRIQYPPMFAGLRNFLSFKHIFDAKFLALGAILLAVGLFVNLICVISPFWFKLVFSRIDGTFGGEAEKRTLSINVGIFFVDESEFDNLVDLNKNNNQDVVPKLMVLAQVLEVTGTCMLVAALAASAILVIRKLGSATTYFILAFFSSLTGIFLVLVFVLTLIMSMMSSCEPDQAAGGSCKYRDNLKWRVFPIYSQFYRVESLVTPQIKLNWAFYISLIGAIIVLAGSALIWLEAFMLYKQLKQIRYTQLSTARSQYEGDIDPSDHRKYVYRPPEMSGPQSYGMQPVMFQGGPYGGPPPPKQSIGFDDSYEDKRPPSSSSPPTQRRSPPPRRRSPSPDSRSPSPPTNRRRSPPPRRRSPSPPSRSPSPPTTRRRSPPPPSRRRSPSPPRRGPPSLNSSVSEGPYISREIDL